MHMRTHRAFQQLRVEDIVRLQAFGFCVVVRNARVVVPAAGEVAAAPQQVLWSFSIGNITHAHGARAQTRAHTNTHAHTHTHTHTQMHANEHMCTHTHTDM